MNPTSHLELSRTALQKNIRFLKRRIGKRVLFTSVVKGNAYGHGTDVFVRLAEDCGVRSFAVFSADEALEVLRARTHSKSKIMIMGAIDNAQLEWAIDHGISFYVFDLERARLALRAARRVGKPARIHLELETGMHRVGLEHDELEQVADLVEEHGNRFVIAGVSTHFAGAESVSNDVRIQRQLDTYRKEVAWLDSTGLDRGMRHTASSAAVLAYPEALMDMVRVGIAQYGYWPSQEIRMRIALEKEAKGQKRWVDPLKRVITWKSSVMAVKDVPPGEFIGYGTSYLANTRKKIAVVPVGYSSGFTRKLSNTGRVLIHGRRFAVVGMVNMNMVCVDVSEAPDVALGDEVVLIGRQKKRAISVSSFSEMSQFLNYEMLVRLPREIPRLVVD